MLNNEKGWRLNHKRVERIWRREGLKVPRKQPKRSRLWLNDGSCIRLRPEHKDHIWSYDFMVDRTTDGRAFKMDTHLAVTTEKLRIKMPYARGDRNDHRTCIEFLESIMSEAKERLRREEAGSWKKYHDPISDWGKAHNLLVSWANRASHTGSLVPAEVENLLQACEVALSRFKCNECGTYIWQADQTSQEIMQCRCGKMQWRYG